MEAGMKTITITITVPDGAEVTPVVTSTPVQNGPQAAAPVQGGSKPACPKHGYEKVDASKFGGWYCKAADDSEAKGYCSWKAK